MLWFGWIIVTSREKVVLVGSILPNDSFLGWVKHYSSTILWMYIICNYANMKRGRSGLQHVRCIFDTFWLFPIDHPTIPGKMSYTKESHVAIETGVLLSLSPQDRYEWVCWWCCFLFFSTFCMNGQDESKCVDCIIMKICIKYIPAVLLISVIRGQDKCNVMQLSM